VGGDFHRHTYPQMGTTHGHLPFPLSVLIIQHLVGCCSDTLFHLEPIAYCCLIEMHLAYRLHFRILGVTNQLQMSSELIVSSSVSEEAVLDLLMA
jgi:hypothetical protein